MPNFLYIVEGAVKQVNRILDSGSPDELMHWLQKPEGLLPVVDPSRPNLYMDNLKNAKLEKKAVSGYFYSEVWIKFLCSPDS